MQARHRSRRGYAARERERERVRALLKIGFVSIPAEEWICMNMWVREWESLSIVAVLLKNGTVQQKSTVTLTLIHAETTPPCIDFPLKCMLHIHVSWSTTSRGVKHVQTLALSGHLQQSEGIFWWQQQAVKSLVPSLIWLWVRYEKSTCYTFQKALPGCESSYVIDIWTAPIQIQPSSSTSYDANDCD